LLNLLVVGNVAWVSHVMDSRDIGNPSSRNHQPPLVGQAAVANRTTPLSRPAEVHIGKVQTIMSSLATTSRARHIALAAGPNQLLEPTRSLNRFR
jgi:hypothetical protein